MSDDMTDFIDALAAYVAERLAGGDVAPDYNVERVLIVDARNHLFRPAGKGGTDEADELYALRELCRVDEDTMDLVPDRGRLERVARNYFYQS